jgi:hypothetical protein
VPNTRQEAKPCSIATATSWSTRIAPDQRGQRQSAQGLEPARNSARAQRLPSRHRLANALECDLAEIAVFEQITGQPAGAGGDDYCVGFGQGLQARGEIGRITGHIMLDNLAADDYQPGGNPDTRVELFGLIEPRYPIDQCQPASRGTLGVVLMSLRISEINQDAVAHVASDKPAKALDNLCDTAMVGADDPAQILRI